jgi:hypothetical protein
MFVVGGCMVDFFKSLTENPSFGQFKGYANELFVLVFSGFKAGKGERRNAGLAVMHRFGAKADRTPCGGAPSEGVERGRADLRSIFRAQITGTSSAAERSLRGDSANAVLYWTLIASPVNLLRYFVSRAD